MPHSVYLSLYSDEGTGVPVSAQIHHVLWDTAMHKPVARKLVNETHGKQGRTVLQQTNHIANILSEQYVLFNQPLLAHANEFSIIECSIVTILKFKAPYWRSWDQIFSCFEMSHKPSKSWPRQEPKTPYVILPILTFNLTPKKTHFLDNFDCLSAFSIHWSTHVFNKLWWHIHVSMSLVSLVAQNNDMGI